MYAASRADISSSRSSLSSATTFGSLVRVGAGTAVDETVGCSVDFSIGADTLGCGCGGVALSDVRSAHSCSIASSSSGGGLFVPWIAVVSWRVACTILSAVVTVGTLIA